MIHGQDWFLICHIVMIITTSLNIKNQNTLVGNPANFITVCQVSWTQTLLPISIRRWPTMDWWTRWQPSIPIHLLWRENSCENLFLYTGADLMMKMLIVPQIAALKWLQQNIKHFGGNPELVTLFGYRHCHPIVYLYLCISGRCLWIHYHHYQLWLIRKRLFRQ